MSGTDRKEKPREGGPSSPDTTWTPDLALGMPVIDHQHRELLDRIDGLLRAIGEGRAEHELRRIIGFLETYVVLHFGTEEKLMVRAGYPGYAEHRSAHEGFQADFVRIKAQFDAEGPTDAVAAAVGSRVRDWWVKHVRTVDTAFGAFLKAQPVNAPPPAASESADAESAGPLSWTPDLAVGVEMIDEQHRELFRRVNKVLVAARKGLGRAEVGAMLDFLGQYVVFHFDAEEDVMRSSSYPDFRAHKAQHEGFKKELARMQGVFTESGATVPLVLEVNRAACGWLTTHIRGSDCALGRFLASEARRPPSR